MTAVLPLTLRIILQKLAIDSILISYASEDGIENASRCVDFIDGCLEIVRFRDLAGFGEGVFVVDPPSVNWKVTNKGGTKSEGMFYGLHFL